MNASNFVARAGQRGRTLLELLVAMAIGLVVIGALVTIYLSTSASSRQSSAVSRLNEDAGIAMNLMGAPLRMAGFSLPRVLVPPGAITFDGVRMTVPDRHFIGAGIRGCDRGFVAHTAPFASLACATGGTGTAAFAVRHEGALATEPDTVEALLPPATDCLDRNVTATTPGALGSNYLLVESRYFVRVGPASGTLELTCAGNGGGLAITAQPVVQFVEELRVRYGVAADAVSRQATQHDMTAAAIDALPGTVDQRWSRVVSVQLCIVLRSAERDPAGVGSYRACDGTVATSDDGFARRAYGSVFTLRNRGGFARSPA